MAGYEHMGEGEMAAEDISEFDTLLICGICFGHYRTPRYLPTCGHSFCEDCLLEYTRNIQQICQGSIFACPLCRKPNYLPEENELTLPWVQTTFPLNTFIGAMMKTLPHITEHITGEQRKVCDPCREEGETNTAWNFCFDCKERLCETCTNYHRKVKLTKDHTLIDVTMMSAETLNAHLFSAVGKCEVHPKRDVEFYCKSHDAVICSLCSTYQHTACIVTELDNHDVSVTIPQDDTDALITQMKRAVEYLTLLQTMRMESNNNFQQTLKEVKDNIEHVRTDVMELMDNIVNHVADVVKQIEKDREDINDADTTRLSKIKEGVERDLALLDTVELHGSEKQKFVSSHLVIKQFETARKQIYEEDKSLNQLNAELVIADDLKKVIENTNVENLVAIKVIDSRSKVIDSGSKVIDSGSKATDSGSSHTQLATALAMLRDKKLVKTEEHTICSDTGRVTLYYGVSVFNDGRVIVCDNNIGGYLHLYNPTNRTERKLMLDGPNNAVQIDDTHLAACVPVKKTISIVTVGNDLKVTKTFHTQNEPQAIVALDNGQLAVAWDSPPAFGVIDITGPAVVEESYFDQDGDGRIFQTFQYLAVDQARHHVIQPCYIDAAVYCFDFQGQPVFKYTDPRLTYPQGVALDKYDNIYVCEFDPAGSIHKLSPTGDLISVITEGVPPCPLDICSDVTGTGFWVTQDTSPGDEIVYFKLEED